MRRSHSPGAGKAVRNVNLEEKNKELQSTIRRYRAEVKPIRMTNMLRQLMGDAENTPEFIAQSMVRIMSAYEDETEIECEGD